MKASSKLVLACLLQSSWYPSAFVQFASAVTSFTASSPRDHGQRRAVRSMTARGGGQQSTVPFFSSSSSSSSSSKKRFKLVQVQIIHRHGDRTPITPMADKDFWEGTLPVPSLLSKMTEGTKVITTGHDGEGGGTQSSTTTHAAMGVGPFGKLTQLGILQMVDVGSRILDDLHMSIDDGCDGEDGDGMHSVDEHGHIHINQGRLFTNMDPLHLSKIKVTSTNFPRTIQSVQALLLGLFPDGYDGVIEIDVRHTDLMIPDPQPRRSIEQIELERALSKRDHLRQREKELESLAARIAKDLHHLVDHENAHTANFGIGEESEKRKSLLSFSQLSEVMTCLKVRNMLPESISGEDYETITSHSAWKWFENLRDETLAKLAMKSFMNFIMGNLHGHIGETESSDDNGDGDDRAFLHIYSCHDSSLIGLMCAFKLEQPAEWPEYGSFIKVELFEAEDIDVKNTLADDDDDGAESNASKQKEYFVRFSLNGTVLRSSWGLGENGYTTPADMICLDHLTEAIERGHGQEPSSRAGSHV